MDRADKLKKDQPIRDFMVTAPVSTDRSSSLATANRLVQHYNIRHLPITRDGRLFGIVAKSDLDIVVQLPHVDLEHITVESVLRKETVEVDPDAPLGQVIAEMAKKKYELVLITRQGKIEGVFSVIDALHLLHETFQP